VSSAQLSDCSWLCDNADFFFQKRLGVEEIALDNSRPGGRDFLLGFLLNFVRAITFSAAICSEAFVCRIDVLLQLALLSWCHRVPASLRRMWLDPTSTPAQRVAGCRLSLPRALFAPMGTKSRDRFFSRSVRASEQRAAAAGKVADNLAARPSTSKC